MSCNHELDEVSTGDYEHRIERAYCLKCCEVYTLGECIDLIHESQAKIRKLKLKRLMWKAYAKDWEYSMRSR